MDVSVRDTSLTRVGVVGAVLSEQADVVPVYEEGAERFPVASNACTTTE